MAPELPGFYYDETKRKYFKILPHHAVPTGAKYTPAAIKAQAQAALTRQQQQQDAAWHRAWAPIQRRQNLPSSATRFILDRSLQASGGTGSAAVASSIRCVSRAQLWTSLLPAEPVYVDVRDARGDVPGPVLSLAWASPDTLTSLAAGGYHGGRYVPPRLERFRPWGGERGRRDVMVFGHHQRMPLTACTTGDGVTVVAGQGFYTLGGREWEIDFSPDTISDLTFTTSRAHPTSNSRLLLASRNHILTLDTAHASTPHTTANPAGIGSEILDASWLGHELILTGHRNGNIALTDPRIAPANLPSVLRLQAQSGVHSIHGVGDHHVVAGCLRSNLDMFDLRFVETVPKPKPRAKVRIGARTIAVGATAAAAAAAAPEHSRPLFSFAGYQNEGYQDLPVAVGRDMGVVAAACADGGIKVYELCSGRSVGAELRSGHKWSRGVRATALCFSENAGDARGVPALFVGKSGWIEQWEVGGRVGV